MRLLLAYTIGQDLWRIYSLGRNLVQCCRIHFTFTKFMNKLISTKNRIFISLVGPSVSGKTYLRHEWLKVGTFQLKFEKICFFYQHPQPLYDVKQKEIDNLEFVQGVHIDFIINPLKNNGTKYLLNFDDSCAEICNSNEFVDIATAGRHRELSTIYIKHNLFHQSKLRRDVELQNTHIVLFKWPRDVHQVATLSVQLGLGSALVDWYRDATTVPFGHLLIDLSPRTDDRLRYCTDSGNIPSKFYVPNKLKHLKYLDDEPTKSLYSPSIPVLLPRMQNSVSKTCPKEFIRFLSECIVNLLQGNLSEVKRRHFLKYRDEIHELFLKRTTWKQRRSLLSSQKGLLLIKTISPFVINHLSWDGTVCSSTSLCLQQQQ